MSFIAPSSKTGKTKTKPNPATKPSAKPQPTNTAAANQAAARLTTASKAAVASATKLTTANKQAAQTTVKLTKATGVATQVTNKLVAATNTASKVTTNLIAATKTAAAQPPKAPPSQSNTKDWGKWLPWALLFLLVFGAILWFLNHRQEQQPAGDTNQISAAQTAANTKNLAAAEAAAKQAAADLEKQPRRIYDRQEVHIKVPGKAGELAKALLDTIDGHTSAASASYAPSPKKIGDNVYERMKKARIESAKAAMEETAVEANNAERIAQGSASRNGSYSYSAGCARDMASEARQAANAAQAEYERLLKE